MKFWYVVKFVKLYNVSKFHRLSYGGLINIIDKKNPLYRAWGLILHNIDCVPFPGVVRGRRQAEEEEGEVRTLIKVSTEVRDVIVCVCVCVCVVCVCAIGSSTEYSIP